MAKLSFGGYDYTIPLNSRGDGKPATSVAASGGGDRMKRYTIGSLSEGIANAGSSSLSTLNATIPYITKWVTGHSDGFTQFEVPNAAPSGLSYVTQEKDGQTNVVLTWTPAAGDETLTGQELLQDWLTVKQTYNDSTTSGETLTLNDGDEYSLCVVATTDAGVRSAASNAVVVRKGLNMDTNNDGVADKNIDTDGDGVADKNVADDPVTVTLTVKETGEGGAVLSGASVTLTDKTEESITETKSTGNDGTVTFENVIPGSYTCTVSKPGYDDVSAEWAIAAGSTAKEIKLTPSMYTVTFTVKNGDNTPLQGATATLTGTDYTGTTNENGIATIQNVRYGTYHYTVALEGYKTATGTAIEVHGAKDIPVTMTVQQTEPAVAITGTAKTEAEKGTITLKLYAGNQDTPKDAWGEPVATITAQSGEEFTLELEELSEGEYFLVATCEGFTSCYVYGITGSVDIAETLELFGGDMSGDGSINDEDYLLFMAQYANGGTAESAADLNKDGRVNDEDFLVFITNYSNAGKSKGKVIVLTADDT